MIKYTIKAPSQLNASINLPASKSISNRALVISAMAGSHIQPDNLSDCDDTEVIVAALQNMPEVINIKAAGTAMRFMTAYLSATPGEHTITGTERMQNRPIGILVDAQRYLGAARTSAYYAVQPFIGVLLSLVFFRELPGTLFFIALALMAVGTWLLTRDQQSA